MTDDELTHYGVKGMRWGVRKSKDSSEDKEKFDFSLKNPKVRNAAIAAAAVTAIIGTAYVATRLNVKLKDIPADKVDVGKKAAEKVLKEADDIIYLTKPYKGSGVRTTLSFATKGNTEDYFTIFDRAGLNSDDFQPNMFKKLSNGSVAAYLTDMFGRVDDATRPIPHVVLIPPNQAVGLESIEDVIRVHGPRLQSEYTAYVARRLAGGS